MKMKFEKQSTKFIKPYFPTPPTHHQYKLGFIDELVPVVDVGLVLFFSPNGNDNPDFVFKPERSLEKTLTQFYPLAGRYVSENHMVIDCNDQGVEFIYAKVNTKLEDVLVSDVKVRLIDEFIPLKGGELLLAIQVTTFECGGVAIGVNANHKIVDASTLSTFINKWAVMNREGNKYEEAKVIGGLAFNSTSFFPGRGLSAFPLSVISSDEILNKYTRKKLLFTESEITKLKVKMMANRTSSTRRLSKVQLVAAIIWKALMGINREIDDYPRHTILLQTVNLREKMGSLIPKDSCGNLWGCCGAECKMTLETTIEDMVHLLSDSVKKEITNFSKTDPHTEEAQMMVLNSYNSLSNIPETTDLFMLTSWCKFPFYEVDFGFGNPIWAAPGVDPVADTIYFMDDMQGNGVEAYVLLENKDVPYFEQALKSNAKLNGFSFV